MRTDHSLNISLLDSDTHTLSVIHIELPQQKHSESQPTVSLQLTMPCYAMVESHVTRKNVTDLLVLIPDSPHSLSLAALTGEGNLLRLRGDLPFSTTLEQAAHSRVDIVSDGRSQRFSVALWSTDELVNAVVSMLLDVLGASDGWSIRRASLRSTWSEFSTILLSHPLRRAFILPLHLLGQDYLLKCGHINEVTRIGNLVVALSSCYEEYSDWRDFWHTHFPATSESSPAAETIIAHPVPSTSQCEYIETPDIFTHLEKLVSGDESIYPPINHHSLLRSSQWICEVFSQIKHPQKALECMVKHCITQEEIAELSPGVMVGVRQILQICQSSPVMEWSSKAFELIGRNDCMDLVRGGVSKKQRSNQRRTIVELDQPVSNLVSQVKMTEKAAATDALSIRMDDISAFRFNEDQRLLEVSKMLQTSEILMINSLERSDLSDTELTAENAKLVGDLCERTFAISVGRALFTLDSTDPISTKAFSVPPLELSVKLLPNNSILSPDTSSLPADFVEWPDFHNGVAAGLQVSKNSSIVDASWILLNKPHNLTGAFGGFLLGLGLNGHLRALRRDQSFPYLVPKHSLTSTGFLLGLAASNVGTGQSHVADQLIWHIPAFMPAGSVEMDHAPLTQASSLLGLGILYLGTRHRKTAARLLQECRHQQDMREWSEPYTLSAALAFGCVMVGRGTKSDEELLRIIYTLMLEDVTSSALTLALGMMYLRSDRQDIIDLLEIPQSESQLGQIRPEKLLFRSIAKHLIFFDSVGCTRSWIDSQVPPFMKRQLRDHHVLSDALQVAYYNIIGAACFVIGLRYAGTALEDAYLALYELVGTIAKVAGKSSPSFSGRSKRMAARSCLNIIFVALASVMAGTGDLRVLKLLHSAHGQVGISNGTNYGSHVAVHMSIGLLFLGGGRYTLGTSPAATAAMIVAFFPRYPSQWIDHRAHPQAYRHFWMLAAEPRCLVTRDAETGQPVYVPIKVKLMEEGQPRSAAMTTPTLLPDIKSIISIRIDSPRYWPLVIDFSRGPIDLNGVAIKRRTGHLSYQMDPRGNRSIFSRSSGTNNQLDLEFPSAVPLQDLSELASSFASDTAYRQLAQRLYDCGPRGVKSATASYCAAILLECLVEDKSEITWLYISLLLARINLSSNTGIRNLQLGLSVSTGSIVQTRFLKSSLQSHTARLYDDVFQTDDGTSWNLSNDLWKYLFVKNSRPSNELSSWLLLYSCPCRSILCIAMNLIKSAREESLAGGYQDERERLEEGISLVLTCSLQLHDKVVKALMGISQR